MTKQSRDEIHLPKDVLGLTRLLPAPFRKCVSTLDLASTSVGDLGLPEALMEISHKSGPPLCLGGLGLLCGPGEEMPISHTYHTF